MLTVTATAADTLTIGINATNQVTINGSIVGAAVSAANVSTLIVNGGTGNNRIDLSGVTAANFPRLTNIRVDGGAGNDRITGSPLGDSLTGGSDVYDFVAVDGGNDPVQQAQISAASNTSGSLPSDPGSRRLRDLSLDELMALLQSLND
jgi:hypothetical protein